MSNNKKVDLPCSSSAALAESAQTKQKYNHVEHIFIRIDAAKIKTATGYDIWEVTTPQFESISVINAERNMAILGLFEKLPDSFWNEIVKTARN